MEKKQLNIAKSMVSIIHQYLKDIGSINFSDDYCDCGDESDGKLA